MKPATTLPIAVGQSPTEAPEKSNTSPLAELRAWLTSTATRCRSQRWFGALFLTNVAQDILSDVVAFYRRIQARAYRAEQHVREALRLKRAAQSPDSPGGECITPAEAKPIDRLLERAAEDSRAITEAASA